MAEELFVFPLSFAQQRLWFLDQLLPGNSFYNIPAALRLSVPLSIPILEQSLNEIVERHEALRTSFPMVDGGPVQEVKAGVRLPLTVTDLREMPENERETEALRQATEEAQRPFDLSRGPLVRTSVLRLDETEYVFLLTMHHIVTDGWSMNLFFQELSTLYSAFVVGRPSPLPELAIQYADYAVWQREWLRDEVLEGQLGYWQEQLRELPVLQLPTDQERPAVQSFRGAAHKLEIAESVTGRLRELSQKEGATLFMTLLAVFKVLLYRYTGQGDIVVGSPIAGRNRAEIETLIGFFVNTLVLRTEVSGEMSFREVLGRVKEVCLGAYAHQDLPFEMLVEKLQPDRDLSRNPLFQVTFQLLSNLSRSNNVQPAKEPAFEVNRSTAIFDLALNFRETSQLTGQIEYNTDLFEEATIIRLGEHFKSLLAGIVGSPEQQISQLPLLSEQERRQLVREWNQTAAEYPREACVHELFEAQAARTPEAVAVIFDGQQLNYEELNEKANQLARYLRRRGVGVETLVGVMVERSTELIVSLLGVMKAGGAYVPLDASYPAERLRLMVADAGVKLVITQAGVAGRLGGGGDIETVKIDECWQEVEQESGADVETEVKAENLAYVMYTSGSTGRPKGVAVPHRGLVNYLNWCTQAYKVGDGEGAPVHSSLSFDLTITSLFSPLLAGRKVHLIPEALGIDSLSKVLQDGVEFSLVKLTPAHLEVLSKDVPHEKASGRVKRFIIGGESLSAESLVFWQTHAPQTILINEYGPTETVVGCCTYEVPRGKHKLGPIPIGRPISNTELYIVDQELQPVPVRVAGQLLIGGDGLARGYLGHPGLTAEKFIPDPFSNRRGARLYQTGDLARYRSDGTIEFLGRIDGQIKLRGYRIELGEVEAVLSGHPGVRQAVVVAREEKLGDKSLTAYVVGNNGNEVITTELRSYLREKLPEYMVPSSYVVLTELPLTPNGKIDRQTLPQPDTSRSQSTVAYVQPRNPVEEIIAVIWSEVLNTEPIGTHDNFFTDLGGHSLIATQLISRVRDTFKVELPLRRLFETPTIAGLAEGLLAIPGQRLKVEKTAELLIELERLSAEEVEMMLSEKTPLVAEG